MPTARAKAKEQSQSAVRDTWHKGFGGQAAKPKAPAAARRGGSQREKQSGERSPLKFIDSELTKLGVPRRTLKTMLADEGVSPDDFSAAVGLWNQRTPGGPSIVDIISKADASPCEKRAALLLGPKLAQLRREAGVATFPPASGAWAAVGGSDVRAGDALWSDSQPSGTEIAGTEIVDEPQQAHAAPEADGRETAAGAIDRIGHELVGFDDAEPPPDRPEGWERTKASDRRATHLPARLPVAPQSSHAPAVPALVCRLQAAY